jgi:hypothetical protein
MSLNMSLDDNVYTLLCCSYVLKLKNKIIPIFHWPSSHNDKMCNQICVHNQHLLEKNHVHQQYTFF